MSANTEYLRGQIEERSGALSSRPSATFTERGNDVWARRSGRTFLNSPLEGGAKDFSSPVAGNGMGNLSRLVGGKRKKATEGGALGYRKLMGVPIPMGITDYAKRAILDKMGLSRKPTSAASAPAASASASSALAKKILPGVPTPAKKILPGVPTPVKKDTRDAESRAAEHNMGYAEKQAYRAAKAAEAAAAAAAAAAPAPARKPPMVPLIDYPGMYGGAYTHEDYQNMSPAERKAAEKDMSNAEKAIFRGQNPEIALNILDRRNPLSQYARGQKAHEEQLEEYYQHPTDFAGKAVQGLIRAGEFGRDLLKNTPIGSMPGASALAWAMDRNLERLPGSRTYDKNLANMGLGDTLKDLAKKGAVSLGKFALQKGADALMSGAMNAMNSKAKVPSAGKPPSRPNLPAITDREPTLAIMDREPLPRYPGIGRDGRPIPPPPPMSEYPEWRREQDRASAAAWGTGMYGGDMGAWADFTTQHLRGNLHPRRARHLAGAGMSRMVGGNEVLNTIDMLQQGQNQYEGAGRTATFKYSEEVMSMPPGVMRQRAMARERASAQRPGSTPHVGRHRSSEVVRHRVPGNAPDKLVYGRATKAEKEALHLEHEASEMGMSLDAHLKHNKVPAAKRRTIIKRVANARRKMGE